MWVTADSVGILTESATGDPRLTNIVTQALARVKGTLRR